MEDSIHSSMSKSLCSKETTASPEESGWTMYFEEFMAAEKREETGCSSSIGGGSSLISDAASCVAWKSPARVEEASESCGELSFKKRRRRRGVLDDESLEDTASSPVSSPKVGELNHLDMNPRKEDDNRGSSQGKGVEVRRDEKKELGFIERSNECTELKKRGLCLVPMSILLDFLG